MLPHFLLWSAITTLDICVQCTCYEEHEITSRICTIFMLQIQKTLQEVYFIFAIKHGTQGSIAVNDLNFCGHSPRVRTDYFQYFQGNATLTIIHPT